ncbi:MAG: ATP synthase F0 subunit C [Bryobacterales bacterium]|nr:ATP synthase F0 subunit C [Bryobacterales bacterium]MBV9398841.1 ATP synthase F0 subunit C [Bryobacterales bacterium]
MRNKMMFLILALLLIGVPAFAQGPAGGITDKGLMVLGLGIAGGLCGIGQGKAVSGAAEAIARNPGAQAGIRFALILGLVFIETLTIYALAIVLRG